MIFAYVSSLSISVLAKYSQLFVDQAINVWNWLSPTVDFSSLSVHVSLLSCSMFCGFLAWLAELIKYQARSKCCLVCLDFNQGGTNRNHSTQRLVILRAQTY